MASLAIDPINPVTLITGAASGLGAAAARALAKKATGGLLLVDRDEGALAAVADSLPAAPERVSTLAFDVADAARWDQAVSFIQGQYGRLDWALAHAGDGAPPPGADADDWRRLSAAHVDGAFLTLKAAMRLMRLNSEGGAILVTGSAGEFWSDPDTDAEGRPARPGLLHLMQAAAREGAADQVRVNALITDGGAAAAWRAAPLFQDLVRDKGGVRGALRALAAAPSPAARYAATGDEMQLATLLLTESDALTGATLVIDGGYTL